METNRTGYAEYLEHHGIKGQRWGIRRTPEQLGYRRKRDTTVYGSAPSKKEKSSKTVAKGESAVSKFLANRREAAAKREKDRKEAARKKALADRAAKARQAKVAKKEALKKAEEKAKEDSKRREQILKDPVLLLKHKDEFSTEELNKAVQRFNLEKSLQELSLSKLSRGEAYIRTAVKYANASIDAYNIAARVVNTFGGTDLPVINKGDSKKDKKDKKDNQDNSDSSTINDFGNANSSASRTISSDGTAGKSAGQTGKNKRKKKK